MPPCCRAPSFVGHDFGWSDFNIDERRPASWSPPGVSRLPPADVVADPAAVLPSIRDRKFAVTTSDSIVGTARNDRLHGTNGDDVTMAPATSRGGTATIT